jgi:hypothetical protein
VRGRRDRAAEAEGRRQLILESDAVQARPVEYKLEAPASESAMAPDDSLAGASSL